MGEIRSDPRLNIFEISGLAWATTVHKAAAVLAAEPGGSFGSAADVLAAEAVGGLSPADSLTVDAELARAGIVDAAGNISAHWVMAVGTSAFAPIKVTTVSQAGLESSHCELGLAGGRGIAVSYRRRISRTTLGVEVAAVRNAVEISFFRAEDAWAAAARSLPAMAELHAAPSGASGFDGERTTIPLAALPPSLQAVTDGVPAAIAHARCTVRLDVAASDHGSGRTRHSAAVWALAGRLYSLRTKPGTEDLSSVDVPPGDIGREFAWRILGAREFVASSAAQAA